MKYVLDASVALKWVLQEPGSDTARALRAGFRQGLHELLAPDIFPAEIGHAIARAERRKIVNSHDASLFFGNLLTTLPRLYSSVPLLSTAYSMASAVRIPFYDCLYVALAERERCELVTADTKLVRALQKECPFVVHLSAIP